MRERIKVFTFLSGTGSTVIESPLEDHVNRWLESIEGEVVNFTQSESERPNVGQHVTVCIWYIPKMKTVEMRSVMGFAVRAENRG